jgi:urease alpha subunit
MSPHASARRAQAGAVIRRDLGCISTVTAVGDVAPKRDTFCGLPHLERLMSTPFDLVVFGGTCLTPAGEARVDVGVRDGRVVAFGELAGHDAAERLDARGLHVLPGVIDTQVHFREPGLEHKEDLQTGTAAAALGGVTTVFEMPNTKPSTTTPEALADKVARARGRAWTNFAFFSRREPRERGPARAVGARAGLLRREGVYGQLHRGSARGRSRRAQSARCAPVGGAWRCTAKTRPGCVSAARSWTPLT